MRVADFLEHDLELGLLDRDHRLPLIRLRERRRELVLSLQDGALSLTRARIREIAEVQQAIKAIETVIAE